MEHTRIMFLHYVLITIVSCILRLTEPCFIDTISRHCYQICDTKITWKNASDLCKRDGGNLVTIESVMEQRFIEDLMKKRKWYTNGLWIGSDKLHPEEQRAWANGKKFSYVNWAPGEPNSPLSDHNCVKINTDDGTWNGEKCTEQNGYICENSNWTEPCIEDDTSGHCYQFIDTAITWKNAFDLCQHDGGNLVTIESIKEQKFIEDLMKKKKWHMQGLWIGSDKLHPEEQRAWVNGKKFSYVNWEPGSPNSPLIDENCVEINIDDGTWNDEKCTEQNGYICENSSVVRNYIEDNNTGRWYELVDKLITWHDAFNICDKDGGTLMIIESAEEQTVIADQILHTKPKSKGLWLGSNEVHPVRNRKWTDGTKFTYVNWAEGEPNNSPYVEQCAAIYTSSSMWDDHKCTLDAGYICEKTPRGLIIEYSRYIFNEGVTEPCIKDKTSGHCYQISDTEITWKDASEFCKHDGGNLVTIESVEEQKFIEDLMKKRTFNAFGLWMGSDKLHPDEESLWTNGEKFSYVNWAKGEPNSSLIDENCVEIHTDDSKWNDVKCTERNGYICENSCAVRNYIQNKKTGRWYKLVDKLITWNDAFEICDKDGGTLMIIESPEEQAFIADQIRHTMLEVKGLWIGSNIVHPVGKRTWTNGKKFTYVNWAEGEPNNSPYVENCAEIYTSNFTWNDRDCTFLRGYICEKTPEVTPYKLQEVFIIITTVGSALVIFVGVMILCCILHKRNKCKKKNEDYQDERNMEMNQAEHEYNRVNVLSGTYCTVDDNQLTPDS